MSARQSLSLCVCAHCYSRTPCSCRVITLHLYSHHHHHHHHTLHCTHLSLSFFPVVFCAAAVARCSQLRKSSHTPPFSFVWCHCALCLARVFLVLRCFYSYSYLYIYIYISTFPCLDIWSLILGLLCATRITSSLPSFHLPWSPHHRHPPSSLCRLCRPSVPLLACLLAVASRLSQPPLSVEAVEDKVSVCSHLSPAPPTEGKKRQARGPWEATSRQVRNNACSGLGVETKRQTTLWYVCVCVCVRLPTSAFSFPETDLRC